MGPSSLRAAASLAPRRCAILWDAAPLGHAAFRAACSMRRACRCRCTLHVASVASALLRSERRMLRCTCGMLLSSPSDWAPRSCAEISRWCAKHVRRQRDVRVCGDFRSLRSPRGTRCRAGRSGRRRIGAAEGCESGVQKGGVVFMSNGVVAVKGGTIAVAVTVRFPSRTVASPVLRCACCTVCVVCACCTVCAVCACRTL